MLWGVKEEKDQVGRYVAARDFVGLCNVQSVCVCVCNRIFSMQSVCEGKDRGSHEI